MKTKTILLANMCFAVFLPAAAFGLNFQFLTNDPLVRYFTEEDWEISNKAFDDAIENNADGVTSEWENPNTGASGTITPVRTYEGEDGERCRTVVTEDRAKDLSNRFTFNWCKSPDGVWRIPAK